MNSENQAKEVGRIPGKSNVKNQNSKTLKLSIGNGREGLIDGAS